MGTLTGVNPFVGPRALGPQDPLYGRATELGRLRDRLVADRIVLLYSPSGAGKTSLVEAGLRDELGELDFLVPPTIRLGRSLGAVGHVGNAYETSALAALDMEDQATLEEAIRRYEESSPTELCLFFDQFEELFTLDPGDHRGRIEFVEAVGAVLKDRRRWALFALREDFLAQLDPFLEYFPTLLTSRFRLDLLSPEAAAEAARRPAEASGLPFSSEALELLINDLRSTRRPGHSGPVPGRFVEPVQLQVVCRRLWNAAAAARKDTIEDVQIEDSGGVDAALQLYSDEQIASAADRCSVSEALLRSWIGTELVDENGFRRPTMTLPAAGPLALQIVQLLEDAHLIRADERRGSRWYELAHDRLVAPIVDGNEVWAQEHLDDPVVRADLWNKQRLSGLLLKRRALRDATAWHREHPDEVRDIDRQFLAASKQRRWYRRAVVIAAALIVGMALVSAGLAVQQSRERDRADRQATIARSTALAFRSDLFKDVNPAIALYLATEAVAQASPPTADAVGALVDARFTFGDRRWQPIAAALGGHTDNVRAVAWSPDGKLLATAGGDGRVQIIDVSNQDRNVVAAIDGQGYVRALAWAPDGGTLAGAADDGVVTLWDPADGLAITEILEGHSGVVADVTYSPDGLLLATAGWDNSARVWDPDTGRRVGPIMTVESGGLAAVEFSPDGTRLATAGGDGTARVWDVASGEEVQDPLAEHAGAVSAVAWSLDGTLLATASEDLTARLWNVDTGQPVGLPLVGHEGALTDVAFDPSGRALFTSSWDSTIRLWDLSADGREIDTMIGHRAGVAALALSPDGLTLATGSDDRTARLWDVAEGVPVGLVLEGHPAGVIALSYSPDGSRLVSGDAHGGVRLWDVADGRAVDATRNHSAGVTGIRFSPDGVTLLTGSLDGTIRSWTVGESLGGGRLLIDHPGPVNALALSADGAILATADEENAIRLWDPASGDQIGDALSGHTAAILDLSFSPDGSRLASSGADATVRFWDPDTGDAVGEPIEDAHPSSVSALAFSPDGSLLATGGWDANVRLWDVETGEPYGQPLIGHRGQVVDVAWSPSGLWLASAGRDSTARLWSVADQQDMRSSSGLDRHDDPVLQVVWAPDERSLTTGSEDQKVRVWDVLAVDVACELVKPYLDFERTRAVYLQGREPRACLDAG